MSSVAVTPAFATRTIQVVKSLDVGSDVFARQLVDLKSYQKIFPEFIVDVEPEKQLNRTKLIVDAQGKREAYVTSKALQNNTLLIEVLSGDLKGTKVVTSLINATGFDGTPNGATIVQSTLVLETSWFVTLALSFVDDDVIGKAVGDGFYEIGQYAKSNQQTHTFQVAYGGSSTDDASDITPSVDVSNNMPNQIRFKPFVS
ncbi:MAG TPA: hypothetical protein VFM64_01925 [Candidatus Nitrosotenuis sp.]|nr:hypothetical protein [Candidatus Nitrosotenuis sp.]